MRTIPELATLSPNYPTNGRTFELTTDLTCIAPLHGRRYELMVDVVVSKARSLAPLSRDQMRRTTPELANHHRASTPHQRQSVELRQIQRTSALLYSGSSVASGLKSATRQHLPRIPDQ
ncbi:hypothetical protein TNCV_2364281 [Trichonephila clavipes]|nr:hypothetical protein TNCV_2364281 [Trichonephila clavipes]